MISVCVADDEIMIRRSLRHKLSKIPIALDYLGDAGDGREALDLYRSQLPDIFIVDIRMPGMSGLELIQTVREIYPDSKTCFIIISGYEDFDYMQQAIRVGVGDYLKKLIIQEELNHAISQAIQRLTADKYLDLLPDSQAIIPFEDFSRMINLARPLDNPALLLVTRNSDIDALRNACQNLNCGKLYMVSFRWAKPVVMLYVEGPADLKAAACQAYMLSPFCETLVYGIIHEQTPLHALEQADMVMNIRFA